MEERNHWIVENQDGGRGRKKISFVFEGASLHSSSICFLQRTMEAVGNRTCIITLRLSNLESKVTPCWPNKDMTPNNLLKLTRKPVKPSTNRTYISFCSGDKQKRFYGVIEVEVNFTANQYEIPPQQIVIIIIIIIINIELFSYPFTALYNDYTNVKTKS